MSQLLNKPQAGADNSGELLARVSDLGAVCQCPVPLFGKCLVAVLCCCVPRVPLVPHTSHPPLLHLGRPATDIYTFLSNLIVDDKLNLSVLKFFGQIELIFDWT